MLKLLTYNDGLIHLMKRVPSISKKNIFLDKDGVLIREVRRGDEISSPRSLDEIIVEDSASCLNKLDITSNFNLIVVSNQPDISRETIDLKFIGEMSEIIAKSVPIDLFLYCPHQASDGCACRKPEIGMIEFYRKRYNAISSDDWFVGDRESDYELANKYGFNYFMISKPYNSSCVLERSRLGKSLYDFSACLSTTHKYQS